MAQNSKIEWTTHTGNLWHGCTKVHAGCDNCYAETLSHRWGNEVWGNDKPRKIIKSFFNDLRKYQQLAAKSGEVHRVFVGSMMDIFEKSMPIVGDDNIQTEMYRRDFFGRISDGEYPNLMFLMLTKRPSNINKYIPESWLTNPPDNVMFGTSPCDQDTANTLIPQLLKVNGKRFLSVEPQIGDITLTQWLDQLDWIIQGGESGHGKRPFNIDWAVKMRFECLHTHTPYFFKQIDKVQEIPTALLVREFPKYFSR